MQSSISNPKVHMTSKWGAFLTLACAIHCMLMPFISAALPLMGMQFLDSHVFEVGLVLVGLGIGAYSVVKGVREIHQNFRVALLFTIGAVILLSGVLFLEDPYELILVIAGAVGVGGAQWWNMRLSHHAHCEVCKATP